MNYDINAHIGQQIEFFLNSYAAGDASALERVKSNLLDIFSNNGNMGVVASIQEWDKKRKTEIEDIWNKANDALKTMLESKKDEQMFIDVKEIEADVVKSLNELEGEYWDSIRKLFLKNVKKDEL